VIEIVQETPDLTSLEILRRVRERGYRRQDRALRASGLAAPEAGEAAGAVRRSSRRVSQHDFGQVEAEFLNGASQRIHFFASRLKYSRWVRVSVVVDEAVENLVRTLAEHLASKSTL